MKKYRRQHNNTKYTCPLCAKLDPTKQTIREVDKECVVELNCGHCLSKTVIVILTKTKPTPVKENESVRSLNRLQEKIKELKSLRHPIIRKNRTQATKPLSSTTAP
jgi:hypothetical protein